VENLLYRNPWIRALVPLVLMCLVGLFTNTLVLEVSQGNNVLWLEIPAKPSFYVIIIVLAASAAYQIALSRYDNEVTKGFTPKQYEAQIRNRVAEGVAKRSLKLISEGNITQLEAETEAFKRIYGEGDNT
jgi:hypothetical protein